MSATLDHSPEAFTMKSGIRCTHGKLRLVPYRTRRGFRINLVRYCGKLAVTFLEGCPACRKHARNPKAA